MLFAAGFGTRMGALTADRPKPLIPVAGVPLIDRALGLAEAADVGRIVVNLHYRAEQLAAHLAGRGVALSWEREAILETGGGMRAALPLLGDGTPPDAVLALNPDAVWTGENPLTRLMAEWDGTRMDCLLSLLPAAQALGHAGRDFLLAPDGRIARANGALSFAYLGAQIVNPALLAEEAEDAFSLNRLWDRAIARGRAYGLVHRGGWCDVGTPEGITLAETLLAGAVDA
jgi:MurNAc alpha-1-phosphate uridylyltransferase